MLQTDRAERVDYAASIQLLALERGEPIAGCTANLSESGMFVTVPCPFEVGTQVACELPIPGDRLRLQGQVRWVQELPGDDACGPMIGVGIQFFGLSAGAAEALRRFVAERKGSMHTVAVQFEGYSRPIRARAQVTEHGLQLWTALPFLRLRSPVNVSFDQAEDSARSGVLDQVMLSVEQGVPRLKIDVKLAGGAEADADAAQGPGSDAAAGPPLQMTCGAIEEPARPRLSRTISEELSAPLVTVELDEQPDGQTAAHSPGDGPLGAPPSEAAADATLVGADPAATLVVDPPQYRQFWRGAERRRWHRGLWLAALAMAAAAVASLARPQLWSGIADALWPARSVADSARETAAQLAARAAAARAELFSATAEEPATPATPALSPTSAEPPAPQVEEARPRRAAQQAKRAATPTPAPAVAIAEGAPGKAKALLAEKVGELSFARLGSNTVLDIPLRGSIAGASHYPLSAPEGVAINLPQGAAGMALGHYTVARHGAKAVWIRARQSGIQVRVFFAAPCPTCAVTLERGRIRVALPK
jgi:hypothetical protein